MTPRPLVAFREVSRSFGSIEALTPCDLSAHRGEFVSIIGPSGCGKSTLLRLASGLDQPTSGAVEFATDSVGYVFQDATLMPWRTVRKNVGLLAELSGMGRGRTARVTDFADHLPHQLSGGMKMRTSLAPSLVLKPEVFLFDEPFGALDEITRGRAEIVGRLGFVLTREDAAEGTALRGVEMLLSGVTTVNDMFCHGNIGSRASLGVVDGLERIGMRGVVSYGAEDLPVLAHTYRLAVDVIDDVLAEQAELARATRCWLRASSCAARTIGPCTPPGRGARRGHHRA